MDTDARSFCQRLITAESLAVKLAPPPRHVLSADHETTGPALRLSGPGRPPELAIAHARRVKVPPAVGMSDPVQRGRILHALANHELQAVELFAWAVLAFPETPRPFRRGLLAILGDEQRHCQLYLDCLAPLGVRFGDYPVTGHFWNKIEDVQGPLDFVCTMGLTFENANLDFALEYAREAEKAGDSLTCEALHQVHVDEIRHVRFAWRWLKELPWERPEGQSGPADSSARDPADDSEREPDRDSLWDKYLAHIQFPLGPARARGKSMDRASREAAGLDDEFIQRLETTTPTRPSGAPR